MYRAKLRHLSTHFNSIKVRLKQDEQGTGGDVGSFQFHKGTIKTCTLYEAWLCILNFNSIKVRLKRGREESNRALTSFQFHKGTIKTN